MSYSRPSVYPDWALAGTRTNPGDPAINTGYAPNFRPPAEWHNWQFGYAGDWIRWLDQQQQLNAAQFAYDATVGTGGTYADINALIAAITGGANIHKVLVTTVQTLTATQVITSAITDLWFDFQPAAFYSKGLTTTPGISIQGQRITINGGRFTSFNGISDVAIQLESGSKNCRIINANFANNTTDINDLGINNVIANIINEV